MMAKLVDSNKKRTKNDADDNDQDNDGIGASITIQELQYNRHCDNNNNNNNSSSNSNSHSNSNSNSRSNNSDNINVDVLMAEEMNQLSVQERESIYNDIHGITNSGSYSAGDCIHHERNKYTQLIEETPSLLRETFVQLNYELEQLRPTASAFDRCQRLYGSSRTESETGRNSSGNSNSNSNNNRTSTQPGTYINTESFRLTFLRCDYFDCVKAAKRMCSFAEIMYELYGDVGLQRRAYLSDLSPYEQKILRAGNSQIVPGRDRSGRRIYIHVGFNGTEKYTAKSRMRVTAHVLMSLLDDIETQQKGMIIISWYQHVTIFDDFFVREKTISKMHCLPIRVCGVHVVVPTITHGTNDAGSSSTSSTSNNTVHDACKGTFNNIFTKMTAFAIGKKLRPHMRFHGGSVTECLYALQTFGIPSNQIPIVPSTGKVRMKNHTKWIELCKIKDYNHAKYGRDWQQPIIECPRHSDVLSGRGRPVMQHSGNAVLRYIIETNLNDYCKLQSNTDATKFTWGVLRTLQDTYGARFLKAETQESNGLAWTLLNDEAARLKIRCAFRDKRGAAAMIHDPITDTNNAATVAALRTIDTPQRTDSNRTTTTTTAAVIAARVNTYEAVTSTSEDTKRKFELTTNTSMMRYNDEPTPFLSPSILSMQRNIFHVENQQQTNSSTSAFLGMSDGTSTVKRQRSHSFFDCGKTNNDEHPPKRMSD